MTSEHRLFCSKEAGIWGTACSASRRRWIPRWSARRLYRWCYWSGPGSLPTSGWHRWRCCTSSSQGGGCRTRGREEPRKHKDKRPFFIVLFFLNHFLLLWRNSCYLFTPPTPTTPLCGRFSIMPRNGLVISPGGNQPSSSGRALSCSVDELGVKCLNHRWRREGKEGGVREGGGEREVRPNSFTVIAHDTLVNTATAVLEC